MGNLFSTSFNDFVIHYGYWGIFLFFITVDQLTPIPEEVTLIGLGYLSGHGFFNPIVASVFALTAFLLADTVYFFLARSGNSFFYETLRQSPFPGQVYREAEGQSRKNTHYTLFHPAYAYVWSYCHGAVKDQLQEIHSFRSDRSYCFYNFLFISWDGFSCGATFPYC